MSSVYASELSQMCQTRVLMRAVERTRSELPDVLPGSILKSEVGFVACSALQRRSDQEWGARSSLYRGWQSDACPALAIPLSPSPMCRWRQQPASRCTQRCLAL
jgi:hypothetical protein